MIRGCSLLTIRENAQMPLPCTSLSAFQRMPVELLLILRLGLQMGIWRINFDQKPFGYERLHGDNTQLSRPLERPKDGRMGTRLLIDDQTQAVMKLFREDYFGGGQDENVQMQGMEGLRNDHLPYVARLRRNSHGQTADSKGLEP